MPSSYEQSAFHRIEFVIFQDCFASGETPDYAEFPKWWFDVMTAYIRETGSAAWLDTIYQAVDELAAIYLRTKREDLRFVMQYKIAQDLEI